MEYKYHDGVVLRREGPGYRIEIHAPGKGWIPFPDRKGGDIRESSIAAWFEGTDLSPKEAKQKIQEGSQ